MSSENTGKDQRTELQNSVPKREKQNTTEQDRTVTRHALSFSHCPMIRGHVSILTIFYSEYPSRVSTEFRSFGIPSEFRTFRILRKFDSNLWNSAKFQKYRYRNFAKFRTFNKNDIGISTFSVIPISLFSKFQTLSEFRYCYHQNIA